MVKTQPKLQNTLELNLKSKTENIKNLFKIPSHPRNLEKNKLIYTPDGHIFVNAHQKDSIYELKKDDYFNLEKILGKIMKNILIFTNDKYQWIDLDNGLSILAYVTINKVLNHSETTLFYNNNKLKSFEIEYDIVTTQTKLSILKENSDNGTEMAIMIMFK